MDTLYSLFSRGFGYQRIALIKLIYHFRSHEDAFALTPESYFNLGNAYAHNGEYQNAISSYDQVLALQPDMIAAQSNRELVQSILDEEKAREEQREQKPGGNVESDDIVEESDGNEEQSDQQEQPQESNSLGVGDEQLAELWLRNVQTTPADFLRQKFQFQLQQVEDR